MKILKTNMVVRNKTKQFLLKEDGTYTEFINFKVGDTFRFIKNLNTSEGNIKINDIFVIESMSDSFYWIKCINRKHPKRNIKCDWIMGNGIIDFNEGLNILFEKTKNNI